MCSNLNFGFKTVLLSLLTILIIFGCSKDDPSNPAGPAGEWVWSPLGEGVDDRIFAFREFNGNLIVGGNFTTACGISANNIASWNDVAWTALGTSINAEVAALTVYDSKLIAGGRFTTAGGDSATNIAVWRFVPD